MKNIFREIFILVSVCIIASSCSDSTNDAETLPKTKLMSYGELTSLLPQSIDLTDAVFLYTTRADGQSKAVLMKEKSNGESTPVLATYANGETRQIEYSKVHAITAIDKDWVALSANFNDADPKMQATILVNRTKKKVLPLPEEMQRVPKSPYKENANNNFSSSFYLPISANGTGNIYKLDINADKVSAKALLPFSELNVDPYLVTKEEAVIYRNGRCKLPNGKIILLATILTANSGTIIPDADEYSANLKYFTDQKGQLYSYGGYISKADNKFIVYICKVNFNNETAIFEKVCEKYLNMVFGYTTNFIYNEHRDTYIAGSGQNIIEFDAKNNTLSYVKLQFYEISDYFNPILYRTKNYLVSNVDVYTGGTRYYLKIFDLKNYKLQPLSIKCYEWINYSEFNFSKNSDFVTIYPFYSTSVTVTTYDLKNPENPKEYTTALHDGISTLVDGSIEVERLD